MAVQINLLNVLKDAKQKVTDDGPASRTRTLNLGSSVSRLARTFPAVPPVSNRQVRISKPINITESPPMTIKS